MHATWFQSDAQKPASGGWKAFPTANRALAIVFGFATMLGGCVLAPQGAGDEHTKLNAASPPFEPRIEARQLPELPALATWQDVLSRGFLANGELESSYFDWKAAFARIDQAATWPNTNVALSFGYRDLASVRRPWRDRKRSRRAASRTSSYRARCG